MAPRFTFLRDPWFVFAMLLFAVNQTVVKPNTDGLFFRNHFNDLLLIPCAMPILLRLHHLFGWRDDRPPTAAEIGGHLLLWCVLFEGAGPRLMRHATGDWLDVAAYLAGGTLSWFVWNHRRLQPALSQS